MSLGFPAVDSYLNTIPTRTLDDTTDSGFTEDPNVTHAYYTQLSDGWFMQSGRTTTASLDRDGRVRTVSYRFRMKFSNWDDDQDIWVIAHEFGDLITLHFGSTLLNKNATAGPISSLELPASLRPAGPVYGVVNVRNNGANAIGSVYILNGTVSVYAGAVGTNFTNAAVGGFYPFTVTYDRRL